MKVKLDPRPIAGLSGWSQAYIATTGSTNADLLEYAKQNAAADKLWLIADEQVAGRGRRGRLWVSPSGNLHASLFLSNPAGLEDLGMVPLVCAVAVHRAVVAALEEESHLVQVKWPNDILIDGAKVCGMLIEADHKASHVDIVIGCGINIVAHPTDTPYPAIHLRAIKPNVDTQMMFQHLAECFAQTFDEWDRGRNTKSICDYWRRHAKGIGETITVNLANSSLQGICEGINAQGFLLLREPSGKTHEISAGDVFFPRQTK